MGLDQYAYIRNRNDMGRDMFVIESYLEKEYYDDSKLQKFLDDIQTKKQPFKWYIDPEHKIPNNCEYILLGFFKSITSILCQIKNSSCDETMKLMPICIRNSSEDFYWRKNYTLHDYIEQIYRKRCDKTTQFNSIEFELYKKDIINLKKHILDSDSDWDKSLKKQDLEFCEKALEHIQLGKKIVYDSSW